MGRDLSDSREIAMRLKEATAGRPEGSVRAAVSPRLKAAMNFYRLLFPMKQLMEIPWEPETSRTGRDIYVFDREGVAAGAAKGKQVLLQSPNGIIGVDQ